MKTIWVAVLSFCTVACAASRAEEVSLVVTATGPTYRAAVNGALVMALEQHTGVEMSATERASLSATVSDTSASRDGTVSEKNRTEMDDVLRRDVQKWAKGRLTGYTVLSDAREGTGYRVSVEVRFPGAYVVGRDPEALRRMAVSAFNVRGKTFSWNGQTVETIEWSTALAAQLNVYLTQTRKFTMLDRAFDAETNAELARLGQANASPRDVIRLNQKLATDYLVVGEISFGETLPPAVNPLTGQVLPQPPSMFAEVNYRVLLAATGQLKWADTVRLDAAGFPAADLRTFISSSAEAAAAEIGKGMLDSILPLEVVAIAAGRLVIGEGGKQVAVGERFTVNALGETVRDSRTGETIDRVETPVATAEIVEVRQKLSYARVIEGDLSAVKTGARLRRIPVPPPVSPAPPLTTTVKGAAAGDGGIVTPF